MDRVARSLVGLLIVLAPCFVAGCKVQDALYCDPDHPCTDPARMYCDLNGEYAASGGIGRTCIADPFGADGGGGTTADAGLGTACTETLCENDQLRLCGTSGIVVEVEDCLLGCASEEARCSVPIGSNGVTPFLEESRDLDALALADGSTVDTNDGVVRSPQGDAIPVATAIVPQVDGLVLRVFVAGSWTLGDTRIRGQLPVAFVSAGNIVITGAVDGSADGATAGPGALICSEEAGGGASFTAGAYSRHAFGPLYPTFIWATNGSGGGGWGTAGGDGGSVPGFEDRVASGGRSESGDVLVPIRGGCQGGSENLAYRGGGGGALQFVSGATIRLVNSDRDRKGLIHVGGGGGAAALPLGREDLDDPVPLFGSGGGGSGGSILIEAPLATLDPGTGLFAGGGGGGGYGACQPAPHGLDAAPGRIAAGGACNGKDGISTGGEGALEREGSVGGNAPDGPAGSGGGGLGRIRINDRDGRTDIEDGSVVGVLTTGSIGRR